MERFDDGLAAGTARGTLRRLEHLLSDIPADAHILDAPAGQGAWSKRLAERGYRVTALNLDRQAFRVPHIPLVIGDMNHPLPFADETFHAVMCVDGIEHLENPYAVLREFHRILKPAGALLLTTPNISALRSRMKYLLTGFHNKRKRPLAETQVTLWHHISLMEFPTLRYALHRSGLRITTITTNRVKLAAVPSMLLYPLCLLGTWLVCRKEKREAQRVLNREIVRQLASWPVTLGETLILTAIKQDG